MHRNPSFPKWREWLPTLHEEITLHPPAKEDTIESAEAALQVRFTDAIRDLLQATDGVAGPHRYWLVWPVKEIIKMNREYRTSSTFKELYMPFDHLLFFGEVGNGDLFGYPIVSRSGSRCKDNVFRWNHEMDERCWVANNLQQYLLGFTNGTIEA